ncbi:MAG: VOC family protein [Alphaproteobacteria bacterium]|nr:VOC family protein [Alphaproteobacteria bacterium]
MASKTKPIPKGYHAVTPYMTVKGAAKALDFYKKAFGATEVMRVAGPDERVRHAEIQIGDSRIMIGDEDPETGCRSPQALGGSPVAIHLYVEDVDSVAERAVAAGGRLKQPVKDQFYGDRLGTLEDPFGHVWHVSTHKEDLAPDELRRRAEAHMKQHAGD